MADAAPSRLALMSFSAQALAADDADLARAAELLKSLATIIASIPAQYADVTAKLLTAFDQLSAAVTEPGAAFGKQLSRIAEVAMEAEASLASIMDAQDAASSSASPSQPPSAPLVHVANEPDQDPASVLLVVPPDADLGLLNDYRVECLDHLTTAEGILLALEASQADAEHVNTVFRAFHTIKGTSGFLGLGLIELLAHKAENLLDRARSGRICLRGGYADLALRSCDTLKALVQSLIGAAPGQALPVPSALACLLTELSDPEAAGNSEQPPAVPELRLGDVLVATGLASRETVEKAAANQGDELIGVTMVREGTPAADVADALQVQRAIAAGAGASESTARVSTAKLDSVLDMVGELVIAHSMVAQDRDVLSGRSPRLSRNVAHAAKIIRELQDVSMSLRMVPLKATFQKMIRLTRDLAHKSGKQVQLVTEGEDTEIDRSMVERLNDPLVHMIRNSVDHGIESPEQRSQAGKPVAGTVTLRAFQAAGSVVIELSDDGKGLDRERIYAKAVEKGLIEPQREMSDAEVYHLIFRPGFSTADKVTDISGRGVGMDVVKKGVEAIQGRVELASRPGRGTTFTMRLPLTMAITDAMLLGVGADRYLLPIASIETSFRPEQQAVSTVTGRGEMVLVRGELIPVVRLARLFGRGGEAAREPGEGLLIVVNGEAGRAALLVDAILGQQQVVLKSLGKGVGELPGVAGGAILGDGRVGLVLDAAGLLALTRGTRETTAAA